jgi:multiple sugar transport system permease protein
VSAKVDVEVAYRTKELGTARSGVHHRAGARRIQWPVVIQYVLIGIVFVVFAFPVFWIATLSFKSDAEAFVSPPHWIFNPTLVQYEKLLTSVPFAIYYRNSIIVVLGSLAVSMALAVPLAYSLARFKWRLQNDISFFILSQLMLPPAAVVVPFYLICEQLGILRTLWAPMLVYTVFTLPFVAWTMKGFFESLPIDMEEAALVDGAGRMQVVVYIVLPLVLGSLFSTAMLAMITIWNEFYFALVLTNVTTYTAPVSILGLWTQYQVYWGQIAAGGVLLSLPVVAIGLVVQRYLVRGFTLGAIK